MGAVVGNRGQVNLNYRGGNLVVCRLRSWLELEDEIYDSGGY